MSQETGAPANTPVAPVQPPSWRWILFGLGICVLTGVAAILLARQYVQSRPLNLREQSVALADAFEQALVNCRVPKDGIIREEPEPHADAEASWFTIRFNMELPDAMEGSGLIKLVARRMEPLGVSVIESSFENLTREAAASLGEREIIVLRIKEKPPKADLLDACVRVARGVRAWLGTQGVDDTSIAVGTAERREDDQAIWQYVRMDAPCPASMSLDAIADALRASVEQSVGAEKDRVRLSTNIGTGGTTVFAASFAEHVCVDLVLARTEIEPPSEMPTAGSLAPLHGVDGEPLQTPATSNVEDLPLDSSGLGDMELGRKLTGVLAPVSEIPRVALIVDDGGYGGAVTTSILALDPRLTLAILPDTPFAGHTAKQAAELGFEVLVHIPMEGTEPSAGAMSAGITAEEIQRRLDSALARVPGAAGVNNHMGSVFTSNTAAVDRFMTCLEGSGLFFVDSRTSARSCALDLALKHGISAAARDVFLDNTKDPNYIIGQFNHLMEVAKERGRAIGVCHFRNTTAQVLVSMLPQLEKNGIKLVHVSELLQRPVVAKPLASPVALPQGTPGTTATTTAVPEKAQDTHKKKK